MQSMEMLSSKEGTIKRKERDRDGGENGGFPNQFHFPRFRIQCRSPDSTAHLLECEQSCEILEAPCL